VHDEERGLVVDSFREMLQLESKTARRQALRLMHALEREALAIFKVARRLEDPDVTPKDYDKLRAHHARSAIVDRLRENFTEKHGALVHLDDLYERIGLLSKHWYRLGGMILDRVEALRVKLAVQKWRLGKIRRRPGGRAPSVVWDFLVTEQTQPGLADEEVMKSLVRVGHIADQEINKLLLQENIKKHRQRRKARLNVRIALRFLRYRVGGWQPLADALRIKADTIGKVLRGGRDATAKLAYSVARLTDVSIDDPR
jgi:hypothetical protein